MDLLTVNLIVSSLTLFFTFLEKLKFKHFESNCFKGCECDCFRTPSYSRSESEKELNAS